MLDLKATACIEAPADAVWAVLSDLAAIHVWVPAIRRSYCVGASRGVGAVRVCELDGATLHETIVGWDEGRSFEYRGLGAPMMKVATNRWSIEPQGPRTLVTSSSTVVLKGGVFGRALEPLAKVAFARLGARSLASLKYLVENGGPYRGPARALPLAPAAC